MLGLLLLYFIARWVYKLAKEYEKSNAWLYGLLAVATYYGVIFLAGILIGVVLITTNSDFINSPGSELILSLIAIPFGVGGVALLRYLLKRSWERQVEEDNQILDETLTDL